ncbi:hypothetical protein AAGG52_00945 [Bacillus licheniformis]
MTRRVVQWSATNYDLEELQVIQVFEEGISKQDVKGKCRSPDGTVSYTKLKGKRI